MKTNSRKTLIIWSSFLIDLDTLFGTILSFGQPTANVGQLLGGLCLRGNAVQIRGLLPQSGVPVLPLGRLWCLPQGSKLALAADLFDNHTLLLCFHPP